ncbi:RNA polymerase sigma-70 factor [Glycomyces buryatensis]|uniref:RNA polymerase sigma-70 factor n=1 Tax=Glycomyces buryatensis TaxID=2570927 RepID=A0A4S8PZD3_9ACTN|nr:RNA polymerase sigma-70 factor [Glycomyces buryatensis]THV37030.1 RNA polymerase sigma-70 factor [Glycomyces buryatensis]
MSLIAGEVELFEAQRNRLGAIAYRLLGSASEAEDAVQETFLRWQSADRTSIQVPEAWLTKVLTNLCLNQLTSARARRETYVGQWLPEPVIEGHPLLDPADTAEQRESVSLAVMVMMERLSPAERAVYVLREAFAYPHSEIAEILDITEAGSQQTYSRAKRHVSADKTRTEVDPATARKIVEEFLAAATSGQTDTLVKLLTDDSIAIGDGGGKVVARLVPVRGALEVAKFIRGLFKPSKAKREMLGGWPDLYLTRANGDPALVVAIGDRIVGTMTFEISGGRVSAIRNVANPDKLVVLERHWKHIEHPEPAYKGE